MSANAVTETDTATNQYLRNNADYAKTFTGPLPLPPAKHTAVVSHGRAARRLIACWAFTRATRTSSATPAVQLRTDDAIRSLFIPQRLPGHDRDRADPSHRLRDADVYGPRAAPRDRRGDGLQTARRPPSVRRPRDRRPCRSVRIKATGTSCTGNGSGASSSTFQPASSTRSV